MSSDSSSTSGSTLGSIIAGKGSVTVQSATLLALVGVGVMGGRYAERAETQLGSIVQAISDLRETTAGNIDLITAIGERATVRDEEFRAHRASTDGRLSAIERCLREGRRKCP